MTELHCSLGVTFSWVQEKRTIEYDETINKTKTGKIIKAIFATSKKNVDKRGNQLPGKHGIVGSILLIFKILKELSPTS